MLLYTKHILEKLTGSTSLHDVSVEQLQELTEKYSYFGAAQFLLAKKLYKAKDVRFDAFVQKAALHFKNAMLLNVELEADDENAIDDTITADTIVEVDDQKEIAEPVEEISVQNTLPVTDKETEDENYDEEADVEPGESTRTDEIINERLSNLLKNQATEFEKPVEVNETLPEENIPYHRVDYFDSQGIKLDTEKEDDKLGKRLRRFTDWLKDMKSINPKLTNIETTDAVGEIQAQNMAARSNEPKEIVTEAMAEVLVKQDKPEQAIQVYEKLSFSNPSKSAYFAAKIQELKGN